LVALAAREFHPKELVPWQLTAASRQRQLKRSQRSQRSRKSRPEELEEPDKPLLWTTAMTNCRSPFLGRGGIASEVPAGDSKKS
jgi:hypothetical protein